MTPEQQSISTAKLCNLAPVIPVLVVPDAERAEGLAEALVTGGLPVLEVTLRTPSALDVIRRMSKITGGHVGAGTVLTPDDVKRAKDAGAKFAVAPGATETLIRACEDAHLPLLPGAATATEIMRALECGYRTLKFFPAESSGGVKALKSLGGPLPQAKFCPTGGVTSQSAPDYLALDNVMCVGGSWIANDADVAAGNWDAIRERARAAASLPRS